MLDLSNHDAHQITDAQHSRRIKEMDAETRDHHAEATREAAEKQDGNALSRQSDMQESADTLRAAERFYKAIGKDDKAEQVAGKADEIERAL